jgi:hypothetical protein
MTTTPRTALAPTLVLSLALFFSLALPVSAHPPEPRSPSPAPVLAEDFSTRRVLQWMMGSQRRMLQVATVGMCFALWIMMKK